MDDRIDFCIDVFRSLVSNKDVFDIIRANFACFVPCIDRGGWLVYYKLNIAHHVLKKIKKKMERVNTLRAKDITPFMECLEYPVQFIGKDKLIELDKHSSSHTIRDGIHAYHTRYQCFIQIITHDTATKTEYIDYIIVPFAERIDDTYIRIQQKQLENIKFTSIPLARPHGNLLDSCKDDPQLQEAMRKYVTAANLSNFDPNKPSSDAELEYMKTFTNLKTKPCATCKEFKKGSMRKCANCKMIVYCSDECQRANWPLHKLACSMIAHYGARCIRVLEIYNT